MPWAALTAMFSSFSSVVLRRGEVEDEVDLAAAQRLDLRVGVVDVAQDQLVELRRAAPVVRVRLERDRHVGLVLGEDERPAADDGEVGVVVERAEVVDLRPDVLRQDRHVQREHGDLRLVQDDLDGLLVGRGDRGEVLDEVAVRLGGGRVGHHRVEGPGDVLGGDGLAVGPGGVLADEVRPGEPVLGRLPVLGQRRDRLTGLRVIVGEEVVHPPAHVGGEQPDRDERAERVDLLCHGDGERRRLGVVGGGGRGGRAGGGQPGDGQPGRGYTGGEPTGAGNGCRHDGGTSHSTRAVAPLDLLAGWSTIGPGWSSMVWTSVRANHQWPMPDRDRTADLPVTPDTCRTFGSAARKRLETMDVACRRGVHGVRFRGVAGPPTRITGAPLGLQSCWGGRSPSDVADR